MADFARALGFPEADLVAAEGGARFLLTLEQVEALNPYPPVLKAPFSYHPFWLSLGYLSDDDHYRQITWYGGEADTTPSILVPKVWGRSGDGDYFVRYTVLMSREIEPRPHVLSNQKGEVALWRESRPWPDLEAVTWDAYAGGSYDGFEEMGYTFGGMILVGSVLALTTRRRADRRSHAEKPPNEANTEGAFERSRS